MLPVDITLAPMRTGSVDAFGATTGGRTIPHTGLDFTPTVEARRGRVPWRAVGDGIVRESSSDAGAGHFVILEVTSGPFAGLFAHYAHGASRNVRAGQSVKRGHDLGAVGSSGNTSGPHLHFSLWRTLSAALRRTGQKLNGRTVEKWSAENGLVDPTPYVNKLLNVEDAMDAKQYAEFSEKVDLLVARSLKAENDHTNQGQLLGSIRGAATALENGVDWLKKRLGGSVLSDASITASLNDMDQKQLRALADEVGKRISNG